MSSYPLPPAHLSAAEREALAAIAAHERAADADFARRLTAAETTPAGATPAAHAAGAGPGGSAAATPPAGSGGQRLAHRRTVVLVAALVGLVGLALLPGPWLLAIAAVAVLVVIPTVLVVWALHQGPIDPDRAA